MALLTKGYVMPMWSYGGAEAAAASIAAAKATGANSVEIDFNFTTGPAGLQSSSVSIMESAHNSLGELSQAIGIAKAAGMSVWIKPQLQVGTDLSNPQHVNWAYMAPTDPHTWFSQYTAALKTLGASAQAAGADHFILTNELRSMTTNSSYASEWTNVFQEVRTVFKGPIGFNAGAFWGGGSSEFQGIPDSVTNQLDFMGLSAYPRFANNGQTESLAQVQSGWSKDIYGRNDLAELHAWQAAHPGKPLYFTELGSPMISGGYHALSSGAVVNEDFQDQANYLLGSLSVIKTNAPEVQGVFVYEWALGSRPGSHIWDVSYSPIVVSALTQGWHYY